MYDLFKRSPPIVQVVVGLGSLFTGIAMLAESRLSLLVYIARFFDTGPIVLIWPTLLISFGITLIFLRLGYFGYRVLAAPFVLFVLFSASRLAAAGPFWWSIVTVLVTFFLLISVSRRYS